MNRTDRLYAITEELRRAGPRGRTAARLAERFEVSVRTIKRDLLALQDAGAPVAASAGPGGGYVLSDTATLPPVTFTEAQAVAIAAALACTPQAPFAVDGRAALEKILDAMGLEARTRAEELASRVWVRPTSVPRSGLRPRARAGDPPSLGDGPSRTSAVHAIEEGMRRRVVVSLDYTDAQGRETRSRPVEPHLFAYTRGSWYLVGWCRLRDAPRWFRCDRVARATVTTDPVIERDAFAAFGTPPPDALPARPPVPGEPGRASG